MPYERSRGKQCVVFGCNSNQKQLYDWGQSVCDLHGVKHDDCACLIPFRFHCLPKNEEKRRAWLKAINRKDFSPSSKALVCSKHFVGGQPSKENPLPCIQMGYEVSSEIKTPGRRPLVRQPLSCHKENQKPETVTEDKSELFTAVPLREVSSTADCVENSPELEQCTACCCHLYPDLCQHKKITADSSTQTEDPVAMDHPYAFPQTVRNVSTQHSVPEFSIENITSDTEARLYTGLNLAVLTALISVLSPYGKTLSYKMSVDNQILLVLVRLRLGLTFQDIARRFRVSRQLSSAVFHSWIDIMADKLSDCVLLLPRDTIRRTLPASFMDTNPKTTCIIDCTEVFIQRPFSLKARNQTYSSYKSNNTAKFLVAIAPNGYIMYVSPVYGGRASDNFITKSCGFLNYLLPGDEVMADRGFTVGEELCARQVKLNIPAFMKGRTQLSAQETVESRRIASVRIHVERAINRMKSFRILSMKLNIKSLKKLDKKVRVIAALCNLQDSLIKDTASTTE